MTDSAHPPSMPGRAPVCPACGVAAAPGGHLCPKCGARLAGAEPGPLPTPLPSATVQKRRSTLAVVLVVALVAIAAAGGIYAGIQIASDDGQDVATVIDTTTTSTTTPETTTTAEQIPLAYSAEELVDAFGDAVWRVESTGCGEYWTGTAFAIDQHHLVTNHHVVANSTTPRLVGRSSSAMRRGTVIGWSERPDVAVIRVDEPMDLWLEWSPTEMLREGQAILALGYPVPATDFTATPGSITSFQSRAGTREAIRTNAALDRGNSGGPALDAQGRVIGVVTEMAPNFGGFQLVPLIFTYDTLSDLIAGFLAAPAIPAVECSGVSGAPDVPPSDDPDTWTSGAETYGDHPALDVLWDQCAAGDFQACDDLWWMAPEGSDYEDFGDTCGRRNEPSGWCTDLYPQE